MKTQPEASFSSAEAPETRAKVGRRLPLLLLPLLLACGGSGGSGGGSPTSPVPDCLSIGGDWDGDWSMPACGNEAEGQPSVVVTQNGCQVVIPVPGLGTFSGNLVGDRSQPNLRLDFAPEAPGNGEPACTPVSEGGLRVEPDGSISIPFGSAPAPCCQHGAVLLDR